MGTLNRLMAGTGALLAAGMLWAAVVTTPATIAHADAKCAAACNASHDQCLASSHDRYNCDSQRNQCLKACGGG